MIEGSTKNENSYTTSSEEPGTKIILNDYPVEGLYSISNHSQNKKIILSLSKKKDEEPLFLIPSQEIKGHKSVTITIADDLLKVDSGEITEYIDELKLAEIGLKVLSKKGKLSDPQIIESGNKFLKIISEYLTSTYE
jgi:hypothetical protein